MRTHAVPWLAIAAALAVAGCAGAHMDLQSTADRSVRLSRQREAALAKAVELVTELKYTEAAAKLAPLVKDFDAVGNLTRAAEAMFWTAYCHEKLDHRTQAEDLYRLVVRKYPQTAASRQAAERLSRLEPE